MASGPIIDPGPAGDDAITLARQLGMSITVADVLSKNGYDADERTKRFLRPRLADLTVPDLMAGRQAASQRIAHAIVHHEPIAVFGDYDCDGVTSVAIMTENGVS